LADHLLCALAVDHLCTFSRVLTSGAGWNTIPITPTTLAANTTYWLAYNSTGSNDNLAFSGNGVGQFVWKYTGSYGTWPSTWPGTTTTGTPSYLMYATLAGPSNPPRTPLPTATVTMHLAYSYDNANRRTGLTLPDGQSESWGYDGAGRVNSLTQAGSSPNTYTIGHNGAGDITTLMAPNGGQQTWSYDGAGRITGTTWISGTTSLFTQTVTLDAAGQRTNSNDSWGSTSFGYDTAGRLTSAGYPDGSSEADQYDASGNRTVITGTTTLGGTNVITNTYDLADEQTRAVSTVGNTTYSYDGNGNQTASYGITGIVTNTYNDLGQLTQVQGPGTNVSYVYDGQGDRLRSYEQGTTAWTLHNDVQDLEGGLSDLVSDGTADYTYLDPGSGAAPVAAYNQSSTHTTYLGSDVLGSVRLATNPTGAVIGAGAYDAWGVSHPNLGGTGATLLAGLQAGSPFGYAGQYYDAGAGTYDIRAREYNPIQGRFTSEDPQPSDRQVPVTINPYEYAGDMVTDTADPSGQDWVYPFRTNFDAWTMESSVAGLPYDEILPWKGELDQFTKPDRTQYWVPIFQVPTNPCDRQLSLQTLSKSQNMARMANIVDRRLDMVWDVERVEAYQNGRSSFIRNGIQRYLLANAVKNGFWWQTPDCNGWSDSSMACQSAVIKEPLQLGIGYPWIFGLVPIRIDTWKFGLQGNPGERYKLGRVLTERPLGLVSIVAWEQEPGIILFEPYAEVGAAEGGLLCPSGETCVVPTALNEEGTSRYYGVANGVPELKPDEITRVLKWLPKYANRVRPPRATVPQGSGDDAYHGDSKHGISEEQALDIINNPDAVYVSTSGARRFTYFKDETIVIVESPLGSGGRSKAGNVITAYGKLATRGPNTPVTEDMITQSNGSPGIPRLNDDFTPKLENGQPVYEAPAVRIPWPAK
jgi:RHS repeat-associated protein